MNNVCTLFMIFPINLSWLSSFDISITLIRIGTPDSDWNPQRLREATARDLELNPIYNLLSTFPDCPDKDRLAHFDEITKSYCAD